jgi:hypothetical protein
MTADRKTCDALKTPRQTQAARNGVDLKTTFATRATPKNMDGAL